MYIAFVLAKLVFFTNIQTIGNARQTALGIIFEQRRERLAEKVTEA